MNEHLTIQIGGKNLALPEDFSIDMEDVNPIFNDAESYSYEVEVPFETNRAVLNNRDDVQSDARLVELENQAMRVLVDGIPFRSGLLRSSEDQEIKETVTISMISAVKALRDMVADKNCQEIPVKDLIQIGEMIGNVNVKFDYNFRMESKSSGKTGFLSWSSSKTTGGNTSDSVSNKLQLQALGFSFPGICQVSNSSTQEAIQSGGKPVVVESFINVTDEYPTKKYCNARVCYTHYKKNEDGTSGSIVSTSGQYDPYFVLDAERQQSGVCFYLLYFLDCLFSSLGLAYSNEPLMSIGDMKRLAFFTTRCKYNLERKFSNKDDKEFDFNNISQINQWCASRNTKGKLRMNYEMTKDIGGIFIERNGEKKWYAVGDKLPNGERLKYSNFRLTEVKTSIQANVMKMYANSANFPDTSVTGILDSLWGNFGIKFLLNYEKQTVTPIYIRDVLRNTEEPIVLNCELLSVNKLNEKITGVRMKYAAESNASEKKNIIRSGSTSYNTDYDYTDYSKVDISKSYLEIIKKQSSSDKTCYIDPVTGNAYRLKVNADASIASELKPAIFEVGGFSGVEEGDCSTENEDFITELESSFEPIICNDVNGRNEKNIGSNTKKDMYSDDPSKYGDVVISGVNSTDRKQILAMFVSEDMWHENIEFTIKNVIGSDYADFFLDEVLATDECYDSKATDDGNSPLQSHDWGLAIGIMRGGGVNATVEPYDFNYDGNGNSKWRMKAGEYAMSADSLDNWGNEYDYNGVQPGIGTEERFSLKMRAYKKVNGAILCNDDERDANGNLTKKVRSRGCFDTFMSEYSHFLLNRKKLKMVFKCEAAELADIKWDKRYNIGGYVVWIDKLRYTLRLKDGMSTVSADVYMM